MEGPRLVVARVAGLAELPHPLGDDRLHRRAPLLQVGARIELTRVVGEHLPDRPCHREAQVGVDVDLADAVADPLLDLLDGNAPGRLDVAGIRVDLVDEMLRDGRRSVHDEVRLRQPPVDLLDQVHREHLARRG